MKHRIFRHSFRSCIFLFAGLMTALRCVCDEPEPDVAEIAHFLNLTGQSTATTTASLKKIESAWHPGAAVMVLEAIRFAKSRRTVTEAVDLLEWKTDQQFGRNFNAWYRWIWSQEYQPHPDYAKFKAELYSRIDKRFVEYFEHPDDATIRLDEIRWGGVVRDGIPPLKDPKMISVKKATYLADSDVVFGVTLNGDVRCYPKRILAWHEMFKDSIGDVPLCGAY